MNPLAGTAARILDSTWLGNSLRDYLVCLAAIGIGAALVKLFHVLVMRRARQWFERTPTDWDDFVAAAIEVNAVPALYLLVVWHGLEDLYMREGIRDALRILIFAGVVVLAMRLAMALVNQLVRGYWRRHAAERTDAKEKSLHGIITIAKIVIWILAGILLLDNLGIKVSAFVAGLGITGIAVALAAQTILGDLFAYFVIFFDQPFEVGHAIKVGDFTGEVEQIGLKTTRLRGPDGEQAIFSNKFLTDNRIQNYRRMVRRKVVFAFEVDREAPAEFLRSVPPALKAILEGIRDVTFERAHLTGLGGEGPRFEAAYVVETPDFTRHMDIRQELNLGLHGFLRQAGVPLAAPFRTLRMLDAGGDTGMRPRDPVPARAEPPAGP